MKKGLENLQDTINSINIAEAMPKGKNRLIKKKRNYSAPRLGHIDFWSKQRK